MANSRARHHSLYHQIHTGAATTEIQPPSLAPCHSSPAVAVRPRTSPAAVQNVAGTGTAGLH
jgi:hypothetical protein